jgi:NAD(P)-dependent dehydrogenase (short-subunit alcohol dehydrogenase family)
LTTNPTPYLDFTGRVAFVTGAASGIGRATALQLARHGADIFGADVNETGLNETITEICAMGRRAVGVRCDVSNPDDVAQAFDALDQEFGKIDILINDPAIGARFKPEDLSIEDWNRVMAVCITGYFLCAQQAGRRMIAAGKGGAIVNVSSIAGSSALGRGNFAYSTAKGAVNQFTRELAIEWGRHKIRVNAVQPCQVMTPAVKRWFEDPKMDLDQLVPRLLGGIPLGRLAEAEDISAPIVFLASDAAAMITGAILPVDGGNLAFNAGGTLVW